MIYGNGISVTFKCEKPVHGWHEQPVHVVSRRLGSDPQDGYSGCLHPGSDSYHEPDSEYSYGVINY
jgi:hypothetical protein